MFIGFLHNENFHFPTSQWFNNIVPVGSPMKATFMSTVLVEGETERSNGSDLTRLE